jgi:hypothetical protein
MIGKEANILDEMASSKSPCYYSALFSAQTTAGTWAIEVALEHLNASHRSRLQEAPGDFRGHLGLWAVAGIKAAN